ncbi:hypothetical protein [Arthrobacter tumbae]|uniref:hypothetical protein n=1 Tax=Arthrobacter tumbae TaxID=163874 RepID=UPI00195B7DCF|nr:hypothetical protein [Arthrobacter tumbae]MBM7782542.1 hypothetical protein [Arthrobacter tumbae]
MLSHKRKLAAACLFAVLAPVSTSVLFLVAPPPVAFGFLTFIYVGALMGAVWVVTRNQRYAHKRLVRIQRLVATIETGLRENAPLRREVAASRKNLAGISVALSKIDLASSESDGLMRENSERLANVTSALTASTIRNQFVLDSRSRRKL